MYNDASLFEFRGPWGVPVQIGGTIVLLPLVFVSFSAGPLEMVYDLVFVALIVGSIFLHELGHAWGCVVQGVPVRRVMLYGGGGFCEPARSTSAYEDELIVAMGPIVNFAIWALASLAYPFVENPDLSWALYNLARINLFLGLLNMIPVMPLDGGRLFHLALRRLLPSGTAMRIAGLVGLVLTVVWIPAMLWSYLTIGLVLFFIPPLAIHWRMLRNRAA